MALNVQDAKQFDADLKKFARTVGISCDKVVRAIGLRILAGVVRKTPVDTGMARANWNISIGAPDYTVTDFEGSASDATQEAIRKGREIPERLQGRTLWITNALPYIGVLENGGFTNPGQERSRKIKGKRVTRVWTTADGYSLQAPEGMVKITMTEVEEYLIKSLKER